jgi:hypothetical protein
MSTGAQDMTDTFKIADYRFADFVKRFEKLNRKASKLSCDKAGYAVIGSVEIEASHNGKKYLLPGKEVRVWGVAPQVAGHQLLARIEYLSDSKSKLFHTVPGIDVKVDERFRDLDARVCEHCHVNRFRKDTFVVREVETGAQKQIGRNCLGDFLGGVSPEHIANVTSYINLFDEVRDGNDGYSGYFVDKVDTIDVLKLTSAYIATYGWVPKSAASETQEPTAYRVARHFGGWAHLKEDEKVYLRKMGDLAEQPEHVQRAMETVEWVKNDLAPRAKSDYEINLCTLVVNSLTESKHIGLVASAISAYQRATNQKVDYAVRKAATQNSTHIGTVGQKISDLEATITFVHCSAGTYGPVTIVKFLDNNGNLLTWFASGDKDLEVGKRVKIAGTIKALKEYQGIAETQLTRVKVAA